MADLHRIHPVIVDVPPDPAKRKTPSDGKQLPVTAPSPYAGPLMPPPRRKRHGRCCRCLCCAALTVVVLVILLGATAGILYLVFKPKVPQFHVDRLSVTRFDIDNNANTVRDAFEVEATATNPNKRIGIYYDDDSYVTASFNGTELCRGAFPVLYQGHRSTVQLRIELTGETRLDSAVVAELVRRRQEEGSVPLTVRARVPVRIKFGALKLWKMTVKVRCNLVVDSLRADRQLRISSNSCNFKLKL